MSKNPTRDRTGLSQPGRIGAGMKVLETERLVLRWLADDDGPFVLELLNDPSFIDNIADKNVRTVSAAVDYINSGPGDSYKRNGFGLYAVDLRSTGESVGICGLVRRDGLDHVDIGFAFLPRHWSRGYALESATAVMNHARTDLGLIHVIAITNPGNASSIRLLERIGLAFDRMIHLPQQDEPVCLYSPAAGEAADASGE